MTKNKDLPDDTLYMKEVSSGGKVKYRPWGRVMLNNNMPYGDWLVRVRENVKSTNPCRLDPDQHAAVEALLKDLEDEIAHRLVQEEKAQPNTNQLNDHDRQVLDEAQSKLSDDFLLSFNRKSIADAVSNALEVVKKRYRMENNNGGNKSS